MSIECYMRAKRRIYEYGLEIDPSVAPDKDLIAEAEDRLGIVFPTSYRLMIKEYGILSVESLEISGIGLGGLPGSSSASVVWATEKDRERGRISSKMLRIGATGYGPFYIIDCGAADKTGEAPVYEVNTPGIDGGKVKLADSFGEFFEKEVDLLIRSLENDGQSFAQGEENHRAAASYWKERGKGFG